MYRVIRTEESYPVSTDFEFRTKIQIADNSWKYLDESDEWLSIYLDKKGDYYVDENGVRLGTVSDFVEDLDNFLVDMLPTEDGTYLISGSGTFNFVVAGVDVTRRGSSEDDEVEDRYIDDADVTYTSGKLDELDVTRV